MRSQTTKPKKRTRPLENWKSKRNRLDASTPEEAASLRKGWETHYASVVNGLLMRFKFHDAEQLVNRAEEYLNIDLRLEVPNDGFRRDTDIWFWQLAKRHLDDRVENIGEDSAWELVHDIKKVFDIDFADKLIDMLHWQQGIRPSPKRPKPK